MNALEISLKAIADWDSQLKTEMTVPVTATMENLKEFLTDHFKIPPEKAFDMMMVTENGEGKLKTYITCYNVSEVLNYTGVFLYSVLYTFMYLDGGYVKLKDEFEVQEYQMENNVVICLVEKKSGDGKRSF